MSETATRPNLLLIMVDQWRADALGCAGHPVVETPHLDTLAAGGTRFRQAYTACPSCIAARAALFTGMTPAHHGFVGYQDAVNWEYEHTLPRTLGSAGYQTHCVGKMHTHPQRNRVGFDDVQLHDGYLHYGRRGGMDYGRVDDYLPWLRERTGMAYADHIDTGMGCNGYAVQPWTRDEMLHPTAWVTTQSIDFLRRRDPTQPFFLMASYHRPHPPLDPPRSYLERYLSKPLPPLPVGDWVEHDLDLCRGMDSPVPRDAAQVDLARRAYYAQCTFIDHQVNRLFMALSEDGLLTNTVIVFVSDHGDMLYDHRFIAKSQPFAGSAGVPLIIALPRDRWSARTGEQVSDAVVELRDLYPTFCELADTPIPDSVDGHSLLPLMRGTASGVRDWLHGEHTAGSWSNHWLTDGREKYVWYAQSGRELLFDLDSDPAECHNLGDRQPDRLALWRGRLATELDGRPEGFVAAGRLVAGQRQSSALPHAGQGWRRNVKQP